MLVVAARCPVSGCEQGIMSHTRATYSMVIDKIFAVPERPLDFPPPSRNCAPMEVRGSDVRVGCMLESQLDELVLRAFTIGGYQ
jgi:hypothetical protein